MALFFRYTTSDKHKKETLEQQPTKGESREKPLSNPPSSFEVKKIIFYSRFRTLVLFFWILYKPLIQPCFSGWQMCWLTFSKKLSAALFGSAEGIPGQTATAVLRRDNSDNNLKGIYNTLVYYMSAKTDASSQPKPHDGPQKATPSVFILQRNSPFCSRSVLHKPLPAVYKAQERQGEGTLGFFFASGVERSSCFEPWLTENRPRLDNWHTLALTVA